MCNERDFVGAERSIRLLTNSRRSQSEATSGNLITGYEHIWGLSRDGEDQEAQEEPSVLR